MKQKKPETSIDLGKVSPTKGDATPPNISNALMLPSELSRKMDEDRAAGRQIHSGEFADPDKFTAEEIASVDRIAVEASLKTLAEQSEEEWTAFANVLNEGVKGAMPPGGAGDGRCGYVLILVDNPQIVCHVTNLPIEHLPDIVRVFLDGLENKIIPKRNAERAAVTPPAPEIVRPKIIIPGEST